jgi:co-chaperonin GroES (HSP10)
MAIPSADLDSAFPAVNPGEWPVGPRVMIQLQTIREKTQGGIVLALETREVNKVTSQIGKVISMGQIAFCGRDTGRRWPEGVWAKVGDLVRIPKYVGTRSERDIPGTNDKATFIVIDDHQIISVISPEMFETVSEIV